MVSPLDSKVLAPRTKRNAQYKWDEFDPLDYLNRNYVELLETDLQIIREVRNYFTAFNDQQRRPGCRGVDVGSGSNLYPALTMLPFCGEITLSDHSESNVEWLEREVWSYSSVWDQFWRILTESRPCAAIDDPRAQLWFKAKVQRR